MKKERKAFNRKKMAWLETIQTIQLIVISDHPRPQFPQGGLPPEDQRKSALAMIQVHSSTGCEGHALHRPFSMSSPGHRHSQNRQHRLRLGN